MIFLRDAQKYNDPRKQGSKNEEYAYKLWMTNRGLGILGIKTFTLEEAKMGLDMIYLKNQTTA